MITDTVKPLISVLPPPSGLSPDMGPYCVCAGHKEFLRLPYKEGDPEVRGGGPYDDAAQPLECWHSHADPPRSPRAWRGGDGRGGGRPAGPLAGHGRCRHLAAVQGDPTLPAVLQAPLGRSDRQILPRVRGHDRDEGAIRDDPGGPGPREARG